MEKKKKIFGFHRNFGHESQNVEVQLPVLLRVGRHYNEPRHISLLGIKNAFEAEIEMTDYACLNSPECIDGSMKSPTRVTKTEKPEEMQRKKEFIKGTTAEKVQKLIEIMQGHGIEKIWVGKQHS